ncbi:hypothetical protein BASA81_003136 [Batrachochytrium salamandrivorans]|nr:hypothetical protein BASA81_003136 [Batrachochytrium salamandrivorans]
MGLRRELEEFKAALTTEINALKKQNGEHTNALKEQKATLTTEINALKKQNGEHTNALKEQKDEYTNALKEQKDEYTNALKEQKATLTTEINALKKQNGELTQRITVIERSLIMRQFSSNMRSWLVEFFKQENSGFSSYKTWWDLSDEFRDDVVSSKTPDGTKEGLVGEFRRILTKLFRNEHFYNHFAMIENVLGLGKAFHPLAHPLLLEEKLLECISMPNWYTGKNQGLLSSCFTVAEAAARQGFFHQDL